MKIKLRKIIRKLLLGILIAFVALIVVLSSSLFYKPPVLNSPIRPVPIATFVNFPVNYKMLEKEFSKNKIIPLAYKKQIFIALSYFLDLKEVSIEFLLEEALFLLKSQPKVIPLLIPSTSRNYRIVLSEKLLPKYDDILQRKLPFDGQIGVLGHELAHVSYYVKRNNLAIAAIGINIYPRGNIEIFLKKKQTV